MLIGSELQTAIAANLIGAVCVGFLLHWLWSYLNRSRTSDSARLSEMAKRLHEAETAREQAAAQLERREVETAELRQELDATRGELDDARQRIAALETEIAAPRGRSRRARQGSEQ